MAASQSGKHWILNAFVFPWQILFAYLMYEKKNKVFGLSVMKN